MRITNRVDVPEVSGIVLSVRDAEVFFQQMKLPGHKGEIADKILFRHPRILDAAGTAGQGALFKPLHLFGFTISSGSEDRTTFVVFLALVPTVLILITTLGRTLPYPF